MRFGDRIFGVVEVVVEVWVGKSLTLKTKPSRLCISSLGRGTDGNGLEFRSWVSDRVAERWRELVLMVCQVWMVWVRGTWQGWWCGLVGASGPSDRSHVAVRRRPSLYWHQGVMPNYRRSCWWSWRAAAWSLTLSGALGISGGIRQVVGMLKRRRREPNGDFGRERGVGGM